MSDRPDAHAHSDAHPDADDAAPAETKDAFREALERKRGRAHPHESASRNDPKIHDAHGVAGGKRVHRRKSG